MDFIDEILEKQQLQTVLKLNKVFSMGYLPSRKNESYKFIHKQTNDEVTFIVNCLAHSFFNLTNQQLEQFDEFDAQNFRQFYWLGDTQEVIYDRVLRFVRKTGLNVEMSTLDDSLTEGQWKVAVYFQVKKEVGNPDFHFILQEKDGRWSSKEGSFPYITYYKNPPDKFRSKYGSHKVFKLQGYLKVENPSVVKEEEFVDDKSAD